MTQINQEAILTGLVEEHYQSRKVRLRPISPYMFEDRGIYYVDLGNEPPYMLRAFRHDVEKDLLGQATVLTRLLAAKRSAY